ncbi:MAG: cytochrome c [Deltaproteobacteria bacterium]|nr:cytochrome c [Deltaproteobacteria bacterium]
MAKHLAFLGVALLLVGGSAASAADGAAIFKTYCAKCHGETGHSDTSVGKSMKVPPLAGDANIQKMSEADVAARIKSNKKHPAKVKGLSDDDINAVATFVKQLAGK